MQLDTHQFEQARATLDYLSDRYPDNKQVLRAATPDLYRDRRYAGARRAVAGAAAPSGVPAGTTAIARTRSGERSLVETLFLHRRCQCRVERPAEDRPRSAIDDRRLRASDHGARFSRGSGKAAAQIADASLGRSTRRALRRSAYPQCRPAARARRGLARNPRG